MRSIAGAFLGLVLVAAPAGADDLNIMGGNSGKGRGAKAANTGNSSRGTKTFGFFLEPQIGFGYGKFSAPATTTATTNSEATLTGPSFSGILGAVYKSYFTGLRVDYETLSGGGLSVKDFSLGIQLGMTLGSSPVRFYGAFNFIDDLDNAGRKFKANSYIIGASYYFTKSLVANLEYHIRDFGRITQGGVSLQPSYSNALLTISLPIMFGIPSMPDMARQGSNPLKEVGGSMGEWNI